MCLDGTIALVYEGGAGPPAVSSPPHSPPRSGPRQIHHTADPASDISGRSPKAQPVSELSIKAGVTAHEAAEELGLGSTLVLAGASARHWGQGRARLDGPKNYKGKFKEENGKTSRKPEAQTEQRACMCVRLGGVMARGTRGCLGTHA